MYKLIIKFVIIGVFGGSNLFAQSELMLNHVPSNSSNERFSSIGYDDFIIEKTISRPALTLNSFDGTQSTGGIKYGLGLKQVLQKLYRNDIEIIEIINEIKENLDLNDFQNLSGTLDDKRKIIEANSRLLQDLAFTALATYVLEKNGYSTLSQQKFGISHAVALGRLKDGLVNPKGGVLMASELVTDSNWSVEENAINIGINSGDLDPVKLTNSLSNVARAIDLYLAIENAYEDLGGNLSLLLNASDKQFWNDEIYRGTKNYGSKHIAI